MKILICSILRNRFQFMRWFYFLLNHLVTLDKENEYAISIFENDSQDGTDQWLRALDWSFFNKTYISSKKLSLPFLSDSQEHAASMDRVKILSLVRNECINQVGQDLNKYDKILFLEAECLFYYFDVILRNIYKIFYFY